jgi:hypothetical protein
LKTSLTTACDSFIKDGRAEITSFCLKKKMKKIMFLGEQIRDFYRYLNQDSKKNSA